MWSCKTKGILRAFLEESGSWGSEHLLPEPRVPGAGRLAGGWAEGTATGPLTPPACSPSWASLPTGPAEARATLTRTGACLCTRPPSGPEPGFTSLLGLVTPSPQCPLSLLQPHRSSCSLCSHHTPACLGLCISCSVRLAHTSLLSPLILQSSLLTRSEQWNISFHISKQRMSQAPAIAAPTDSELRKERTPASWQPADGSHSPRRVPRSSGHGNTGPWPQTAEVQIKGSASVNLDSSTFPRTERHPLTALTTDVILKSLSRVTQLASPCARGSALPALFPRSLLTV